MTRTYGIKQARPKLGDIITVMEQNGHEIILTRNGRPVARLIPYVEPPAYGVLTDLTTGEQLRAATAAEHAASLAAGEPDTFLIAEPTGERHHGRGAFETPTGRWVFVAGGPETSAATVEVNVIDGRISVAVADATDTDIYHHDGRVLACLADVEPWGAEEPGMERADAELADMGWRRINDWVQYGDGTGWNAHVAPTTPA